MVRKKVNGSTVGNTPTRPMTLREFGHHLDSLLLDRGWSQADLHRRSGLSKDTISKWVAGKVEPNPYNLGRVASAFGMTPDELYPHYMDHTANPGHHSKSGIEFSSADMATGLLKIERRVSTATARQIMDLLEQDAAEGN